MKKLTKTKSSLGATLLILGAIFSTFSWVLGFVFTALGASLIGFVIGRTGWLG